MIPSLPNLKLYSHKGHSLVVYTIVRTEEDCVWIKKDEDCDNYDDIEPCEFPINVKFIGLDYFNTPKEAIAAAINNTLLDIESTTKSLSNYHSYLAKLIKKQNSYE